MTRECDVDRAISGKRRARWLDRAAAELGRRQYGRVSRVQLLALGFSADQIHHRVRCGRLHVIHRGVYAVGHATETRPVRVTWRQLTSGRGELEADLRRLVEGATLAA